MNKKIDYNIHQYDIIIISMNNNNMDESVDYNHLIIRTTNPTKLYDIRKVSGQEGYNSYYNGTMFCPRDMKIIGCGTGKEKCVFMTEEEKQRQCSPLKRY